MTPLPGLLTISPNLLTSAPAWVLVCYDFSKGATSPVTISLTFSGEGDKLEFELSAEEPCMRVYVPAGCTGGIATDQSVQSLDAGFQVQP